MTNLLITLSSRTLMAVLGLMLLMALDAGTLHAATDLGITKITNDATPTAGGAAFSYTLTVTNSGPDDANDVVVLDPLPAGIIFHSVSVVNSPSVAGYGLTCSGPAVATNGLVSCNGNLPAPAPGPVISTSTITIVAQVVSSVAAGVRTNTATVASDTQEASPNTNPNSASVQQNIQVNGNLALAMVGMPEVIGGNEIIYQIALTNNGSSDAINPTLTQTLPAGTEFLALYGTRALHSACTTALAGSQVQCNPRRVPAGTHYLVVLAQTYAGLTPSGTATSTTTLSPGNAGGSGSPATVETEVLNQTTVTVSKTFSDSNPATVAIGLQCSDPEAEITVTDGGANLNDAADFVVTGYADGTTCTAAETNLPAGYSTDNSECTDLELVPGADAPCTIANQQLPVDIFASKVFTAGGATATFAIDTCGGEADIQVVTNSASTGSPAHYIISNFPWDGATCNVTEPTPPDGYYEVDSTCSGLVIVPSDDDTLCTITNAPTRATFEVTKSFSDDDDGGPDNPTTVDVTLSCFTGLPLIQTQTIDQDQGVEFVVDSYTHGDLDCDISEALDVPELAGYTPTYTAGGNPGGTADADGCHFDDQPGGAENTCEIVNDADPVEVVVEKLWVIEGEGGHIVDQNFKLTLYCDAEIVDASEYCPGGNAAGSSGVDAPGGFEKSFESCKKFEGNGSQSFTASVTPEWPTSHCWVVETVYDDSIEIDNDCGDLTISHGEGDSCVITNTVFFEGIPTLSQYGLAMLALLMLGIGLVGFRRFA